MTTFWRSELERLVALHRADGHVIAGGPGLDPEHLDAWFWHVVDKAGEEGQAARPEEIREQCREGKKRATRTYVSNVMARHRARIAEREDLAVRRRKLSLSIWLRNHP